MFNVTMGSYDGAEICDLVGLFLLHDLAKKFGSEHVGLYRDDGLAIIQSKSARIADKMRKDIHEIFRAHGVKITAEINHQTVNFLDITLKEQCHAVRTRAAHNNNRFGNSRKSLGRYNPPLFRSCIMSSEVRQNMHILQMFYIFFCNAI